MEIFFVREFYYFFESKCGSLNLLNAFSFILIIVQSTHNFVALKFSFLLMFSLFSLIFRRYLVYWFYCHVIAWLYYVVMSSKLFTNSSIDVKFLGNSQNVLFNGPFESIHINYLTFLYLKIDLTEFYLSFQEAQGITIWRNEIFANDIGVESFNSPHSLNFAT